VCKSANVQSAILLGKFVADSGGCPVIPHTLWGPLDGDVDETRIMGWCLDRVEQSDALVWATTIGQDGTESLGTKRELTHATALQKPIFCLASPSDVAEFLEWVKS
jgi:hypothetical protein